MQIACKLLQQSRLSSYLGSGRYLRILFLYTELSPAAVSAIQEIACIGSNNVLVLHWGRKGNTPFVPPMMEGVIFTNSESLSDVEIKAKSLEFMPDVTYITAWQDRKYLRAANALVKRGRNVVAGFDDIWEGTLRQKIGSLLIRAIGRRFFTHAMVSGPRQYEYARRFGFADNRIVYYLFSGNVRLFSESSTGSPTNDHVLRDEFLFVGRFQKAKAIDVLVDAFRIYKRKFNGTWNLTCVGNGEDRCLLEGVEGITVLDYLSQTEIVKLLPKCGAFVLASRLDPSPLVVHEFATAGLPLLLSENIGNRAIFLIDGFNGFKFRKEDSFDLASKMNRFSQLPATTREKMGENSILLAKQHNPIFVANSLLSVASDNLSQ